MTAPDSRFDRTARRNLVAQLFIVLLVGIAYQEMVTSVLASFRSHGITFRTAALATVFILTSLRFFIGAQLHLIDPDLLAMRGLVWFFDYLVIVTEMLVLILLGSTSSPEANQNGSFRFWGVLVVLLAVDVVWIGLQWGLGRLFASLRRKSIPWPWAVTNLFVVGIIAICHLAGLDFLSSGGLHLLFWTNGVAFVADVLIADYADIL